MVHTIPINDFLNDHSVIIDVRSPAEFNQGHIPGSYNIPILNNEERHLVGTTYKQWGNERAVMLGYELVGHKFKDYIVEALHMVPQKEVRVLCYRGGMRSRIMSELFSNAGLQVKRLNGGYKDFRQTVLNEFNKQFNIKIIGGYTGSNKTELIKQLQENGKQTIDLEGIASHKGSAFGGIGEAPQPTQEQFENILYSILRTIPEDENIWIEDEARMIGKLCIPEPFFQQMRKAPVYFIETTIENRIINILNVYGKFSIDKLSESTMLLYKRLGDEKYKEAIRFLMDGDLVEWVKIILYYYDKTYNHGLSKRDAESIIRLSQVDFLKKFL